MSMRRRIAIALTIATCTVAAACLVRTGIVIASTPVATWRSFDPTFMALTKTDGSERSTTAVVLADDLGIRDRRLSAARYGACMEGGSDCSSILSEAAVTAPYDADLELFRVRTGATAPVDGIARSCTIARRETWAALQRIPLSAALPDDEFGRVSKCFESDVSILLTTAWFSDATADLYVGDPAVRARMRQALALVEQRPARAFLRKVKERSGQSVAQANR